MPATGTQAAEDGLVASLGIKMVWLRIELDGKSLDVAFR